MPLTRLGKWREVKSEIPLLKNSSLNQLLCGAIIAPLLFLLLSPTTDSVSECVCVCVCVRVLSNGRCRKVSQSLQSDYREYGQRYLQFLDIFLKNRDIRLSTHANHRLKERSTYRFQSQQQQAHSRVVNVFGCFSIKMYPIRNSLS